MASFSSTRLSRHACVPPFHTFLPRVVLLGAVLSLGSAPCNTTPRTDETRPSTSRSYIRNALLSSAFPFSLLDGDGAAGIGRGRRQCQQCRSRTDPIVGVGLPENASRSRRSTFPSPLTERIIREQPRREDLPLQYLMDDNSDKIRPCPSRAYIRNAFRSCAFLPPLLDIGATQILPQTMPVRSEPHRTDQPSSLASDCLKKHPALPPPPSPSNRRHRRRDAESPLRGMRDPIISRSDVRSAG